MKGTLTLLYLSHSLVGVGLFSLVLSGCSLGWKSVKVRELEEEVDRTKGRLSEAEGARQALLSSVDKLQAELRRVQEDRAREIRQLMEEKEKAAREAAQEKTQETQDLIQAQKRLAESLKQELGEARAKLSMTERGLVLTLLDEIFFDSGKAVIKPEGIQTLEKVATVLKETVPDSPVAVEGHTDNEPIKVSGWRSNWELSSARALAVVHYFIDQEGLPPERLRAVGGGEYQPVASNETAEGCRQNRRVEIVILPHALKKVRQ
jgi:chemotaxis protein MotB